MAKLNVKVGDTVMVITGEDSNKKNNTGKVQKVFPETGRIIVEGINMVKKHVKPRKMGEAGGIVEAEGAMYACKAQVVCPSCKKATRVKHKIAKDGSKIRVCGHKDCGEEL